MGVVWGILYINLSHPDYNCMHPHFAAVAAKLRSRGEIPTQMKTIRVCVVMCGKKYKKEKNVQAKTVCFSYISAHSPWRRFGLRRTRTAYTGEMVEMGRPIGPPSALGPFSHKCMRQRYAVADDCRPEHETQMNDRR